MKKQFVSELREGAVVDACFVLQAREVRATRMGEAFLAMELSDRSGRIQAVRFRPRDTDARVRAGEVVRVTGTVTSYRGSNRISVEALRPAGAFSAEDMLAASRRDRAELVGCFEFLAGEVRGRSLRAVLERVFGDRAFAERFRTCPASRSRHHACLGGLLEHTVGVASLAEQVAQQYPYVDRDLLLAGALLHDVGKVEELSFGGAIHYTDAGRMLGHVVLGERMVAEACAATGAPGEMALRLSHLLLSHHGELEWGSPRRPATLEAVILHHLDNLDAKMAGFMDAVTKPVSAEERWSDAINMFRRPLYAPRPVDSDRPTAYDEDLECCVPAG